QVTAGISRQFSNHFSVDLDYVYSHGKGIPIYVEENIALVNGEYVQPDPRFSTIATLKGVGWSNYNAGLLNVKYRASKGTAEVSYTLSKTTSNNNTNIFGNSPTNPLDLSEDEGPDNTDRRHNLVVNGNYRFPWEIELAGIWVYRSAPPYSATTRLQLDSDPFTDRPEPRNQRRQDSFSSVDIRASKGIRLGNKLKATLFWEVYNLFNTDNFTSYAGNLQSPLFGKPTPACEKPRQQGGFRIDFCRLPGGRAGPLRPPPAFFASHRRPSHERARPSVPPRRSRRARPRPHRDARGRAGEPAPVR